jgi:MFS family permease
MNRNILLVAFSLFMWGLGESFFIYFQPLYLQEWGANPVAIGSIIGGVGIMLALTQIPAGILADKFGSRNLMWSSWIIGVVAAWFMALAPSLTVFVIGYLFYGMTGFGVIPMNVYITSSRGNLSVGRALTFVSGMYNLGAVIGPVAGGFIAERLGFQTIYIVAAFIFMVSTTIILFTQKVDQVHPSDHREQAPLGSFLKNPRFLVFLGMIFITILSMYLPQSFTPSFLQNQHELSRSTIGILGAIGNLGNAFATLVLGNISPYLGMVIGQLWVAIFAGVFLWGESTWWFGLGYFFFGGFRLYRSMILAEARTMVHPGQTGLLYGIIETTAAFSVILAPVIAGFLYNHNPTLMYESALIAVLIMMTANILYLRKVGKTHD